MSKKPAKAAGKKRTAVARPRRVADTQIIAAQANAPTTLLVGAEAIRLSLPATVFVVLGHRGGSHGVVGLYVSRVAAHLAISALEAKGNKHSREYLFTIDERPVEP